MFRFVARLIIVAVVALLPVDAQSEPVWPGSPMDAVRSKLDRMFALVTDRNLTAQARHDAARSAVVEAFDFGEMSKQALGPYWLRMTAKERAEVTDTIQTILTSVYTERIGRYVGSHVDELRDRVRFVGESIAGGTATVTMTVAYFGNDIPLHLALIRRGRGWRIWDLGIDGVQLTENIKAQVTHLDRGGGYGELLARLRERREMLASAQSSPPPRTRSAPWISSAVSRPREEAIRVYSADSGDAAP